MVDLADPRVSIATIISPAVTVYFATSVDAVDVFPLFTGLAEGTGIEPTLRSGEISVVFGKPDDVAHMRAHGASPDGASEAIEALLAAKPESALRIELNVSSENGAAFGDAERFLFAIVADLTSAHAAYARDDSGFVYDPAELDLLGHLGGSRYDTTAYIAATLDAEAVPELEASSDDAAASGALTARIEDCAPDADDGSAIMYVVGERTMPLLEAARVILAAASDPAANPHSRNLYLFAPSVDADELELFADISQPPPPTFLQQLGLLEPPGDAALTLRQRAVRREIAMHSALPIGALRAAKILSDFIDDRRASAALLGETIGEASVSSPDELDALDARLPRPIGSINEGGATLRLYHLQLDRAHEILRKLAAHRQKVSALLGSPAASVTIAELVVFPATGEAAANRADVLLCALAERFVQATEALAADTFGNVIGESELIHLLTSNRGIHSSWTARVAIYG